MHGTHTRANWGGTCGHAAQTHEERALVGYPLRWLIGDCNYTLTVAALARELVATEVWWVC